MILNTVKKYEAEANDIYSFVTNTLDPSETALLYGSVSRAFGPFSDIDVITFGPKLQLPARFGNGTPVQEHVFTQEDVIDYLVNSPRGQHTLIDGQFVHPDGGKYEDILDIHRQQRERLATVGRADFLALMLAEQLGDTSRPDIQQNHTHYALKRSIGGKRAYTRSFSMAQMLAEPPLLDGSSVERIERLLDGGIISEKDLIAIYKMNEVLFRAHVITPTDKEWQDASQGTIAWNEKIADKAKDVVRDLLDDEYLGNLDGSMSDDIELQRRSVDYAERSSTTDIRARTLLWNLMSNIAVEPDVLYRAWMLAERQPRQLRDLGCCAVQLPQFRDIEIDPKSPLLNDPDVQFSALWSSLSTG